MSDPVFAADGHSYERECIEEWFARGKRTSPVSGAPLEHTCLTPNHAFKSMICDLIDEAKAKGVELFP